jgi:hypothetical protein
VAGEISGNEYGAMIKKKAKSKTTKKSTKKKKAAVKRDPAQVREEIAGLVKSDARDITQAVIGEAKRGELAPAKYLFEMAGVYPPVTDGSQATPEEDSLARTLLDRITLAPPRKVESEEPAAAPTEPVRVEEKTEE